MATLPVDLRRLAYHRYHLNTNEFLVDRPFITYVPGKDLMDQLVKIWNRESNIFLVRNKVVPRLSICYLSLNVLDLDQPEFIKHLDDDTFIAVHLNILEDDVSVLKVQHMIVNYYKNNDMNVSRSDVNDYVTGVIDAM